MTIGILALQGDYAAHRAVLEQSGVSTHLVREPRGLEAVEGLVIPGGESTVMSRLCDRYGLREPLKKRIEEGMPVLGTCAGLIFLARSIEGASENFAQTTLGVLDIKVERNAYGAQRESFESNIHVPELGAPIRGVFIRAPRIVEVGSAVEILAVHPEPGGTSPVLVRQGHLMASAFHPEIVGETRVHELWLRSVGILDALKPDPEL